MRQVVLRQSVKTFEVFEPQRENMEKERICHPVGIRQNFEGRSYDIWFYNYVPEGMRRAEVSDIFYGQHVLHKLVLSEGYQSLYVDDDDLPIIQNKIRAGYPVYVKDTFLNLSKK